MPVPPGTYRATVKSVRQTGNRLDIVHAIEANGQAHESLAEDMLWLISETTKPEFDRIIRLAKALSAKPYHVFANPGGVT